MFAQVVELTEEKHERKRWQCSLDSWRTAAVVKMTGLAIDKPNNSCARSGWLSQYDTQRT